MKQKDIKKMTEAIETLGVKVIEIEVRNHIKLKVLNPATGTTKLVTVSGTPKAKGVYHLVKSSVRKVFRKEGEILDD